jgi:hypothetical protein
MRDCLKFAYEVPKQTVPNQTAMNQTMCSQIKTCITKSSCEICAPLRYHAA